MESLTVSPIFYIILMILALIGLIVWILTLVHQASRKRWAWFVLTLIFNITLLIYWIVWLVSPKFKRKRNR